MNIINLVLDDNVLSNTLRRYYHEKHINKNIQIHAQAEINDYLLIRNYYFIFEQNGEI